VNTLLVLVGWLVLFALCWPLALLALVLWPVVWLLSLPFRLLASRWARPSHCCGPAVPAGTAARHRPAAS